jgi:hypothetical protein
VPLQWTCSDNKTPTRNPPTRAFALKNRLYLSNKRLFFLYLIILLINRLLKQSSWLLFTYMVSMGISRLLSVKEMPSIKLFVSVIFKKIQAGKNLRHFKQLDFFKTYFQTFLFNLVLFKFISKINSKPSFALDQKKDNVFFLRPYCDLVNLFFENSHCWQSLFFRFSQPCVTSITFWKLLPRNVILNYRVPTFCMHPIVFN